MGKKPTTLAKTEEAKTTEVQTISPQLAALAREIAAEHAAAVAALKRGLVHAMAAGDLLRQAKDACVHGQWLPYLTACAIKDRTAQLYMRVARHRPMIEQAMRGEIDLTLRNVGAFLAASKAGDDAQTSAAAAPQQDVDGGNPAAPDAPSSAQVQPSAEPLPKPQVVELKTASPAAPAKKREGRKSVSIEGARGAIEALTRELNGEPQATGREEDDLVEYLAILFTESARDAGASPDMLRTLLADAATCAPVFRDPQRWRDALRAQDEMIGDSTDDLRTG